MRRQLAVALAIAGAAWTVNAAYPADEIHAVTFSLNHATSPEAATVLRTIAGVKDLEFPSDNAITVRDTQERLALAAAVVKMLDSADDAAEMAPLSADDGSVIATVVLKRASEQEVMLALRKELHFARFATAGEKRILLRDTASQVQAALKLIARLEQSHQEPQK